MELNKDITYFAETDFRGKKTRFGIKNDDSARHVYIIGKTGMGKSTLLENMAIQDILNGHGVCFFDPHGKSAEMLLSYVPKERINDVVYVAPFDLEHPISFNVMEDVGKDRRHLVADGLMSVFKKIWEDAWSARMEYILNNTILALLEYPNSTLLGVNRMLSDKDYRKKVVDNVSDPSVKSFWVGEFAKYTERFAAEATPAIQNKIGQFTSNPLIRNIVGQPKSSFDVREIMDKKKILIVNLSKGRVGEQNANLLGGMLVTKIYLAAMSRANIKEEELRAAPPFFLFVDEFQSVVNESFADILSEARKYKLNLTIAHQYIEQMPETVRDAVFGNVGTTITFRVGPFDAETLETVFFPKFTKEDLVNLGFAQIYLTLMINGVGSQPFSAVTLPPIVKLGESFVSEIVEASRRQFSRPRAVVEKEINDWHEEQRTIAEREPSHSSRERRDGPNGRNDNSSQPVYAKDSGRPNTTLAGIANAVKKVALPLLSNSPQTSLAKSEQEVSNNPANPQAPSRGGSGGPKEESSELLPKKREEIPNKFSLNSLKPKTGGTANKEDLRQALADLVGQEKKPVAPASTDLPAGKAGAPAGKTIPHQTGQNSSPPKAADAKSFGEPKKEIAEDALRQMLKLDGEE